MVKSTDAPVRGPWFNVHHLFTAHSCNSSLAGSDALCVLHGHQRRGVQADIFRQTPIYIKTHRKVCVCVCPPVQVLREAGGTRSLGSWLPVMTCWPGPFKEQCALLNAEPFLQLYNALDTMSLCSPGWSGIHHLPASASRILN